MKTFIIIAGVFCALIAYLAIQDKVNSNAPVYEKDLNKMTKQFLVQAKKKYDVVGASFGGTLQDKIRVILVGVESKKTDCTVDEARELLVNCVEEYLTEVNKNEKLRPHLCHYPFTNNEIRFRVGFSARNDDAVHLVSIIKGHVYYSSAKEGQVGLVRKYDETYEEAKEKVMAGRSAAVGS